MNRIKIGNKIDLIFVQVKTYFVSLSIMVLLILLMELIIKTDLMGFLPSIIGAFMNFFKLLGVLVVADKLQIWLSKKLRKNSLLFRFSVFFLKRPLLIYSLYLSWYIYAAMYIYIVTDNVLIANVALQSAIAMFMGIVFGAFVFLKNTKKL